MPNSNIYSCSREYSGDNWFLRIGTSFTILDAGASVRVEWYDSIRDTTIPVEIYVTNAQLNTGYATPEIALTSYDSLRNQAEGMGYARSRCPSYDDNRARVVSTINLIQEQRGHAI